MIIMLVGPPGAGKTTYTKEHGTPNDWVVDMDLIDKSKLLTERLHFRHRMLRHASRVPDMTTYFNTAAPTRDMRDYWRRMYGIGQTLILLPPKQLAIERVKFRDGSDRLVPGINSWYKRYEPPTPDEPNTTVLFT